MDFVLGILVGIALCMICGLYASNQARKHEREQQRQMMDYFLEDAIAREDFKEAARIRDLMNKQ